MCTINCIQFSRESYSETMQVGGYERIGLVKDKKMLRMKAYSRNTRNMKHGAPKGCGWEVRMKHCHRTIFLST